MREGIQFASLIVLTELILILAWIMHHIVEFNRIIP